MDIKVSDNKRYLKYKVSEDSSIFEGYISNENAGSYKVGEDILRRLSKDLGFSYDTYQTISRINIDSARTIVTSMSIQSKHTEILLLLDDELLEVVDYSLEVERLPLLNSEFLNRGLSLVGTSDAIELSEIHYSKEDKLATMLLKKVDPVVVEEKYLNEESNLVNYNIGILLVNDEMNNTYSRLVLYVNGQPLYLPASLYNSSSSRYKRSTSSSVEAFEVLFLKVIEDLRDETMYSKLYDLHFRYRANKSILASYEEYNNILRVLRRVPAIIEDNSCLQELVDKFNVFEKKYPGIEEQRSSYIWRCTAAGDITVGYLVSTTADILNDLLAPPMEYFNIRELLGTYISTNRIADEIAKESI